MAAALARYESFLVNNVSTISTVESTLRSVTWILPGRFKDAELASEALSALLNVMSIYHDTILAKLANSDPKYKPLLPASPHTRYTRAWSDKDSRYKWAARLLEVIKYTELLIEMGLRRTVSSKARWKGIVVIEAIKAILRVLLLRITRRPLLSQPLPERDFDPSLLPPASDTSSPTLAPSSPPSSVPSTPEHLKNNHAPLPPHPLIVPPPPTHSPTPVEDYLLPKALTTSSVKLPTALMRTLSSHKDWVAEMLYILRPLVYAIMLSRDQETNRPLAAIAVFEFFSRHLRRVPPSTSQLERAEYAQRDKALLWYFLRGSFWKEWTKPKLEGFADRTARMPGLNVLGVVMKEWIPLIDEYYYWLAIVKEVDEVQLQPTPGFTGVQSCSFWVSESVPATDNRDSTSKGSKRTPVGDLGIVQRNGTHCMMTAIEPGGTVTMHRTSSLDYNILISGKLVLVMEDGSEELVEEPGSVVIQRGTIHAWRNPGPEWARWACVLVDAYPVVVDGKPLLAETRE
ncbi:hypothetical protein NM688_g4609 [Phlebia brevispora]|uniref:Uncharacterized protein n=1 Tax=Phlebia brevispora TaxID=194682 RepID=A0ACC1T2D6_9APHY|nr:hypothetical protein NM688_g4609 [Phlebia brevispora]